MVNLSMGEIVLVVSVVTSAIVGSVFVAQQFRQMYSEIRALNKEKAEITEMNSKFSTMEANILVIKADIVSQLEKKADGNITTMRFDDGVKKFDKIIETLDSHQEHQKQLCLQQATMNTKLENIWLAIEKRDNGTLKHEGAIDG